MLLGRCGRTCHQGLPDCLILPTISSSFQARQTAYNLVLMMERPFSRRGNHMQFHEGTCGFSVSTLIDSIVTDLNAWQERTHLFVHEREVTFNDHISDLSVRQNWPCTLFHSLEV
ncbi:hypothetical protein BDL97_11G080300 [Sphagnum fallax]|nr:hypothetical protein BDL97_11G080300 [Sphagnum fallax]